MQSRHCVIGGSLRRNFSIATISPNFVIKGSLYGQAQGQIYLCIDYLIAYERY